MHNTWVILFVVWCVGEVPAIDAQFRCDIAICDLVCQYGTKYGTNRYGCRTCSCLPAPTCPPLPECATRAYCRLGFRYIDGCMSPTCECNSPTCPAVTCIPGVCPLGYAQDSPRNGCPTCECRGEKSPLPCIKPPCLALLDCPATMVSGCPVCLCGPPIVCPPPPTCDGIVCPQGFAFENGCKTCRCLRNCPTLTCTRIRCNFGFASDSNNCPTCRCNRSPHGPY